MPIISQTPPDGKIMQKHNQIKSWDIYYNTNYRWAFEGASSLFLLVLASCPVTTCASELTFDLVYRSIMQRWR